MWEAGFDVAMSALASAVIARAILRSPDFASLLAPLCARTDRGVAVAMVLPARNGSWVVGAGSRSDHRDLMDARGSLFVWR